MSAEGAIVVIVVFGIVLIIAAVLYTTLFDIGNKEFSKAECRTSLLLTANVQQKIDTYVTWWCVTPASNPIPIKCSRRFLTVTPDDVLKDGKSVKFEYNPLCAGEEAKLSAEEGKVQVAGACMPEAVLAQEMASCWDTFFQGETPVFQQVEPDLVKWFSENQHERACFVCSEVTLRSGKDIEDLQTYLKEKKRTNVKRGESKSYYDFLAKNPEAICNSDIRAHSDDDTCWSALGKEIDSGWFHGPFHLAPQNWPGALQGKVPDGKTYAVTFVRYGMEPQCQLDDDKSDLPTMAVQVLPAEEIGKYCDVVMA